MNELKKPDKVPQFVWDGLTEAGQYYLARAYTLRAEMKRLADELEMVDDAARFEFGIRPGRARLVNQGEQK